MHKTLNPLDVRGVSEVQFIICVSVTKCTVFVPHSEDNENVTGIKFVSKESVTGIKFVSKDLFKIFFSFFFFFLVFVFFLLEYPGDIFPMVSMEARFLDSIVLHVVKWMLQSLI